jgi:diadenosine tetraphosphate (Ap4A) HIT family hydrolase
MISPQDCLGCQVAQGIVVPEDSFVYADDLWTVNHRLTPAPIVGWLILQPRRHIEELHLLTSAEQGRMTWLLLKLDELLRELLAPAKVYVNLYAESLDCPHVHFHIIPRAQELTVRGPKIFGYEPEVYPSATEIDGFVQHAQTYLRGAAQP